CFDFVVASDMNSITPVAALSRNAHRIIRKSGVSDGSDMRGAKPSSRKSITALAPTTMPRPTVCNVRMVGYAQMDGDSRVQVASAVASSHAIIEAAAALR